MRPAPIPTQCPVPGDYSTAPQNISIMKVAQGWVLNWSPPERLPSESAVVARQQPERAEAIRQPAAGVGLMPALSQLDGSAAGPPGATGAGEPSAGEPAHQQQEPAAYSVELREKGSAWHTLATGRDRSLLIKDLRPGAEYMFRVFAHTAAGLRGAASREFRYLIPDNRRKPGGTQALSAGVVSGILFFIACIVIAVCGVNMCNKRRKKRAEKGESRRWPAN